MQQVKDWWESLPLIDKANIIDYKDTDFQWDGFTATDKAIVTACYNRRTGNAECIIYSEDRLNCANCSIKCECRAETYEPSVSNMPRETIETIAGTATFVATLNDEELNAGDYSTRSGYWVIHRGDLHHVYKVKPPQIYGVSYSPT